MDLARPRLGLSWAVNEAQSRHRGTCDYLSAPKSTKKRAQHPFFSLCFSRRKSKRGGFDQRHDNDGDLEMTTATQWRCQCVTTIAHMLSVLGMHLLSIFFLYLLLSFFKGGMGSITGASNKKEWSDERDLGSGLGISKGCWRQDFRVQVRNLRGALGLSFE